MSPRLVAIGIDKLSVAERILLVQDIWDSIAAEAEQPPLTQAQCEDLQRRIAAHDVSPKNGSSWEQVKIRLESCS